jgi:leader peptidase (prepilin peptidase)/N-methyltransferase
MYQLFISSSFEALTGLPIVFGYVFFFLLGAIIGSFLNVVIHRLPLDESIVYPSSTCPKCQKPIQAYDNIPILSWLILGGKCRNCKLPISIRYPAVELLTGLLFLAVFWHSDLSLALVFYLAFVAMMVPLIFIDADHQYLPDVINYPGFVMAIIARIVLTICCGTVYFSDLNQWPFNLLAGYPLWLVSLFAAGLGALVGGGLLWLVGEIWKWLRNMEAMGLGDVKMMAFVGAFLGWRLTLLTIFLGAFSGAVIGMLYIAGQKDKDLQSKIPFGIFLGIGAIIALLFGDRIINWYIVNFIPA